MAGQSHLVRRGTSDGAGRDDYHARRAFDCLPATGVIVGIWWSAWHLLPNVWSSRAASGELAVSLYLAATALGVFVGYLTAFRMLMVWVYHRTKSLFLGILMHASFTASLLILNPVGLSGAHLVIYSFALAAAVWIVVAVERSLELWSQAKANQSIDAEV